MAVVATIGVVAAAAGTTAIRTTVVAASHASATVQETTGADSLFE